MEGENHLRRAAGVAAVIVGLAGLAACGGHKAKSQTTPQASHTSASQSNTGSSIGATGPAVVVASGIPYAANLAFDPHGGLWVVSAQLGPTVPGGVWYVPPGGHPRHVATGLTAPTALTWVGNRLYAADIVTAGSGRITVFQGFTGDSFATHRVLLSHLPVGSHSIGSILPGPGGRFLVGLGAQRDHSGPPGGVVSFASSGAPVAAEATGLRTAFGLALWSNHLLVTDNGPDLIGGKSSDELFAFEPGGAVVNFGFPKCYGQGGSACASFPAPLARFPAHSSPEGIAVKGDVAFVAQNGSSVPGSPVPSEIVRVDLRTGRVSTFWRSPVPHSLVGLAIGPDGNLYATLFTGAEVVRFDL